MISRSKKRSAVAEKARFTHLYTWLERGAARFKCLAQEHNTMSPPGLKPGPLDPESSSLTPLPCAIHVLLQTANITISLLNCPESHPYKVLCCMFLLAILGEDLAQNLQNTKGGDECSYN